MRDFSLAFLSSGRRRPIAFNNPTKIKSIGKKKRFIDISKWLLVLYAGYVG